MDKAVISPDTIGEKWKNAYKSFLVQLEKNIIAEDLIDCSANNPNHQKSNPVDLWRTVQSLLQLIYFGHAKYTMVQTMMEMVFESTLEDKVYHDFVEPHIKKFSIAFLCKNYLAPWKYLYLIDEAPQASLSFQSLTNLCKWVEQCMKHQRGLFVHGSLVAKWGYKMIWYGKEELRLYVKVWKAPGDFGWVYEIPIATVIHLIV